MPAGDRFDILTARHVFTVRIVFDQFGQTVMGSVQVQVVAPPGESSGFGHPGLIRIDLPRVHVEDICTIPIQDAAHTAPEHCSRQKPEITAAAPGQDPAAQLEIADGKFIESARPPVGDAGPLCAMGADMAVATMLAEIVVAGVIPVSGRLNETDGVIVD